ncbi:exonuclease 3'-5' domain-containing protein 2-like [Salvia hispanica]|uniref:exonuclease 3'-5' domain-containing protein 2-like n=1 Tax=Salvia hispanica TaxID=49212 RepID=UPI00200943ED|nr:exonuclease 3'-5' domain-containing protein 2-like [Salvia hispanica]
MYTVPCDSHRVRTTVTSEPSVVRRWVHAIRHRYSFHRHSGRLVAGLGVQWVPGSAYAATLQLCVGSNCLIFQLSHAHRCPAVLRRFLLDPDVIRVGLWNHSDEAMLMRSEHALQVRQLLDVRNAARDLRGCRLGASMGELAEEILGIYGMEKDNEVGRSDWEDEDLTWEQVEYACHDVFLSFLMALKLSVWDWEAHHGSVVFSF